MVEVLTRLVSDNDWEQPLLTNGEERARLWSKVRSRANVCRNGLECHPVNERDNQKIRKRNCELVGDNSPWFIIV